MNGLSCFKEIWLVDFEFGQEAGELPEPRCMVAREYRSSQLIRLWLDGPSQDCPIPIDTDSLFIAYLTSAELNCFRFLGWSLPARILDLFVEFRRITNGRSLPHGASLLGALAYFGLSAIEAAEKNRFRDLALRGGPYSEGEALALLDYCQEDVDALARLLPHVIKHLGTHQRMGQALFRGRYMSAASAMECKGVPIDTSTLFDLRANWDRMKVRVIREVDRKYNVFVPARVGKTSTDTKRGREILRTAQCWGVEPQHLASVVEEVEQQTGDRRFVIEAARMKTGLTVSRLPGQTYSSRTQTVARASRDLPSVLALVRASSGPRHAGRLRRDRLRMASLRRGRRQPAIAGQSSLSRQRR